MHECSALRKPDQEIPILEEIERRIEAAHVEIRFARHEDRGQRNVVVDQQALAVEILTEDPHPRMRFIITGCTNADEPGDSIAVPGGVLRSARRGRERREMFRIEEIVVVEKRDEGRLRGANTAIHRFGPPGGLREIDDSHVGDLRLLATIVDDDNLGRITRCSNRIDRLMQQRGSILCAHDDADRQRLGFDVDPRRRAHHVSNR